MPALPAHGTPTTSDRWDGAANTMHCPAERGVLRAAHAWADPEADPNAKGSYRYIHHMVSASGQVGAASTVACSTGIAALNGGRGGTTIPDSDRADVYAHLARHLRDADLEPPRLRTAIDIDQESTVSSAAERRYTPVPVELRSDGHTIGGYAAMFDRISSNLGGFVERVTTSAFGKSRGDGWPNVVARFDHENAFLLGTTAARTLRLSIDDVGLVYEVDPPKARQDIVELIGRGDVRRSSFAFRVPTGGDEWGLSDQGYPLRTLLSVQLIDVAPVVSPAYADTTAGLRSLAEAKEADYEEVRKLAADNELRRLFTVSIVDGKPKPKPRKSTFGPAAVAALMNRRQDPYA